MGFLSTTKARFKKALIDKPSHDAPRSEIPTYEHEPKGFLAVHPGDSFCNGKYAVRSPLGTGQYSSVWLADDRSNRELVALKILSCEFYNGGIPLFELEVMRRIGEVSRTSNHRGKRHVAQYLHDFEHVGPNGRKHVCIVFSVLGATLDSQMTRARRMRLPYPVVKRISRQLLEALDFLHTECGVLHTDIQTSNILMHLAPQRNDSPVSKQSSAAEDLTTRNPSVFEDPDVDVSLNDFGLACWVDQHLTDRIQPPMLRAPEITLSAPWEDSVDIYDLGCLIYSFVTGSLPFPGRPAPNGAWSAEDDRLRTLMELFGSVPEIVLANASRTDHFFDKNRELRRTPTRSPSNPHTPLEGLIGDSARRSSLGDEIGPRDVGVFCDFLRDMLATDPRRRKTAKELLHHSWLQT